MKEKVYILVLNWNNWKDTVECLESIFQLRYTHFQVICIDNASTDGSEDMIKEWAAGRHIVESRYFAFDEGNKPIPVVTYDRKTAEEGGDPETERSLTLSNGSYPLIFIRSGGNLGYAGGNNVAMRYASKKGDSSFVWVLNNDTVSDKDALSEMVATIAQDTTTGMVGSKLLYYDREDILYAAGGCRISAWSCNSKLVANNRKDGAEWDEPFEPDYICGASLLVRNEVIETVGMFDDRYFLYWEDADWGVRTRRKQFKLVYCPQSRVRHKEGGTTGGVNPVNDYYWTRNGLMFMQKFYPFLLPLAPVSYLAKYTVVRLLKGQPMNFTAFMKGCLDFLRGRTGEYYAVRSRRTR
jgi:GT2 family glycosyltransferase